MDQTTDNLQTNPNTELDPNRKRTQGYIISCDGENAIIAAHVDDNVEYLENYWAVGQLLSVKVGENRVVGLAHKVVVPEAGWETDGLNPVHIHIELIGEIQVNEDRSEKFSTGINNYPQMGCIAHRIRTVDLEAVYKSGAGNLIQIGNLTQDFNVPAQIDLDKLLSRHFAVVGSTGVGKSTSVTLMLRKIVEKRNDIRVLLLDPHNEFASAFPDHAVVVDSSNLNLPFWLFKLDEFAEVIFRGQKGLDAEHELLRDLIPLAKERYKVEKDSGKVQLVKRTSDRKTVSADTPVPYRVADLLEIIDERLGLLDGKAEKPVLKSLQTRIESISQDPRFRFMFETTGGKDVMEQLVSHIFRVPQQGKPICVFELSGLPSEVVNSVASVMCRMAFDLALSSDGAIQTLVVCEEAHRYIPADSDAGFWPTRQAIARIAKEGRKYGVYLGIITQRPGELDPTILSQCNSIFAMRLGNQKDQEIIRGAVTNGAKSTINFLSSIANRECIAFGEAVHTPMRMTFETMRKEDLPGSRIYEQQEAVKSGVEISIGAVIRKMRNEERKPITNEDSVENIGGVPQREAAPLVQQDSGVRLNPSDIAPVVTKPAAASGGVQPVAAPAMTTPQPAAQPQMASAAPAAQAPNRVPPPATPTPSAPKQASGGASNLINAFRKR